MKLTSNKISDIIMVTIGSSMICISKQMTFKNGETLIHMKLCGIVYFGNFHFTSDIIDSEEDVWFHDGMVTWKTSAAGSANNGKLYEYTTENMKTCIGKMLLLSYIHMNNVLIWKLGQVHAMCQQWPTPNKYLLLPFIQHLIYHLFFIVSLSKSH
jgi:hypothetical protein